MSEYRPTCDGQTGRQTDGRRTSAAWLMITQRAVSFIDPINDPILTKEWLPIYIISLHKDRPEAFYHHHHHHHHHLFGELRRLIKQTRRLSYRKGKGDRAMRPVYGALIISRVLSTPTATFAEIFNGLLFRSIL